MRRLAPILALLALTACAPAPVENAAGPAGPPGTGDAGLAQVGPQSLARWASFPVDANPRPLVLLGETVNVREGFAEGDGKAAFMDGRIDANGKVPPEAAEAFSQLVKANSGEPKIKVLSVEKGTAEYATDRGPRELPAWIFKLTETLGSVTVLAVKPDYQAGYSEAPGKVSPDGMTLTVRMIKSPEPCPGEPRLTYEPQSLESPAAVAVGLKTVTGEVAPGVKGDCVHDLALHTTEYTFRLEKPLGNRILVDAKGEPMAVSP